MAQQTQIFDAQKAEVVKNAAIQQVDANADPAIREAVLEIVRELAYKMPEFTTDDVEYQMQKLNIRFREPRALGPAMLKVAREDLIQFTDRTTYSVRVSNHRRPLRVWKSLVYSP